MTSQLQWSFLKVTSKRNVVGGSIMELLDVYAYMKVVSVSRSVVSDSDPMDCSPPGSSVHGMLQAGTLEWVAVPSSRGSS